MINTGLFNQIVNPPNTTTKMAVIKGIFAIFFVCNQLINKAIKIAGTNILVANIILNRFAASISFTIFSGIGAL